MSKKDPAKVFNIVLPQDLVNRLDKVAQSEYRNRSETIREALRDYVQLHSAARRIHGQSEQARESGDPLQALKFNDEAMVAYQEEEDVLGFVENLASRIHALNHLNDKTGDKKYLIYGKYIAMAALEIAEETGDPTQLTAPLDMLARQLEKLGNLKEAAEMYQKAVENITTSPSPFFDRAAIKADYKIRAYTCAYRAGDKTALAKAEEAIRDLEQIPGLTDEDFKAQNGMLTHDQEGLYNKLVWLSGGHMRLVEILKTADPKKAKQHLEKAKKIIDSDPRLTIRKSQLERLAKELK